MMNIIILGVDAYPIILAPVSDRFAFLAAGFTFSLGSNVDLTGVTCTKITREQVTLIASCSCHAHFNLIQHQLYISWYSSIKVFAAQRAAP